MRYLLPVVTVVCAAAVQAQADPAAGRLAYAACAACHGANGEGNDELNSPALAGLDAAYLARQLNNFKRGIRGGEGDTIGMQMRGMAGLLADESAVRNTAAYIASLPAVATVTGSGEADLRNGENQYNAACGPCHGGQAQGNSALHAPRLAGQRIAYVERQYRNFGAGVRGAHPQDRYGRQMQMMATVLKSEKDLADVMGFIASRGAQP